MKSVLISIQPNWCELIANCKKTIEVRKTRPNIETPFKCYIYCTKKFYKKGDGYFQGKYCGKVIGEFVCDEIINAMDIGGEEFHTKSYMNLEEWLKYTNNHKGRMWCWHISDLVIYDEPKELSAFRTICKYRNDDGSCQFEKVNCYRCEFDFNQDGSLNLAECLDYMVRPPQSWCYVEEVNENDRT